MTPCTKMPNVFIFFLLLSDHSPPTQCRLNNSAGEIDVNNPPKITEEKTFQVVQNKFTAHIYGLIISLLWSKHRRALIQTSMCRTEITIYRWNCFRLTLTLAHSHSHECTRDRRCAHRAPSHTATVNEYFSQNIQSFHLSYQTCDVLEMTVQQATELS